VSTDKPSLPEYVIALLIASFAILLNFVGLQKQSLQCDIYQ